MKSRGPFVGCCRDFVSHQAEQNSRVERITYDEFLPPELGAPGEMDSGVIDEPASPPFCWSRASEKIPPAAPLGSVVAPCL